MASSFVNSNPVIERGFSDVSFGPGEMTVQGTVQKTAILLALVIAAAAYAWQANFGFGIVIGAAVVGLALALVVTFKPTLAPVLGPVYAVVEGVFVGAISAFYATGQVYEGAGGPGLILGAVLLTMGVFIAMLLMYATGIIKVTAGFRKTIVAMTLGIFVYYLLSIGLSFVGVEAPLIWSNGTAGILFTLGVVVVAALNLALDFDFIEQGAKAQLPKHMEWYGAFGLTVTVVWLYLSILRLLAKIYSRN